MKHLLTFAVLYLATFSASAIEDFVDVREAAVGQTEQAAVQEAYYAILSRALTRVAGMQAEAEIGDQFRRDFERDFDGFSRRYFTPDTDYRCSLQGNGRQICEVEGTLKLSALAVDLRRIVKTKESSLSNKLNFVLTSAKTDGKGVAFLIDSLTGEIQKHGHSVLTGASANRAISNGQVDFSLGVYDVRYNAARFDPYELRLSGSATVRFKVRNVSNGENIATVPITVSTHVSGPTREVLEPELEQALSHQAAVKIARAVTSSVVTFQAEKGQASSASSRIASGKTLYLIRMNGVSQRDRRQIKQVRTAISDMYNDTRPAVDPKQSNDTRVTVMFSTKQEVIHDDLLDRFYESHQSSPSFLAEYVGDNEFVLNF